MTRDEAQALAHQIVRQSNGVSVRFGCTNGQECLHLIPRNGSAETIYSAGEWRSHRWNTSTSRATVRSPFSALKEAAPV